MRWITKQNNSFNEHLSMLRRFITNCPHIKSDDDIHVLEIEFNFKVKAYCQSCAGKVLEKELNKTR